MRRYIRLAAAAAGGLLLALVAAALQPTEGADSLPLEQAPSSTALPDRTPPPLVMEKARTFTEHGRVTSFLIDSEALGSQRKVNVYLLRGHEYEWLDNTSSASRQGRNAAIIADNLIMTGTMPPVILVMPPQSSTNKEIIALGVNLPSPKLAKGAPGVGPGRFEDFLVKEVIPMVDKQYRTLADRRFRGVDGFSLGGFSAVSLAMRYPNLFASAGAYEGSFVWPGGVRPDGKPDEYLSEEMAATFGTPPDLDLLRRVNPADLAAILPADELQQVTFHIQTTLTGKGDQARAALVVSRLRAKGAVNTFNPMEMPSSKHGWYWADEHLKEVLPRHAAVFLSGI